MTTKIREQWLMAMTDTLREDFQNIGAPLPVKVKVSCGWPSCGARNRQSAFILGECWSTSLSRGGNIEIFISPIVDDSLDVGRILTHELVHAAIGVGMGHGTVFRKVALAMGLMDPMRSTPAGPRLRKRLNALIKSLGRYPHASLSTMNNGRKTQSTRLRKVICPVCGYTVRTTSKWLEVGFPWCPCGIKMEYRNVSTILRHRVRRISEDCLAGIVV